MVEEHKSMTSSLFLFMVVMLLFFAYSKKISTAAASFFEKQVWLTSIIASYPLLIIIMLSFLYSLFTSLFYKHGIDKESLERIRAVKEESKKLREKMNEYKNDPQKLAALQKEMMEKSMGNMSVSFKMMFGKKFLFLLTIPSICFLWFIVGPLYMVAKVGYMIRWGFKLPLFGTGGGWLFCIIVFSFIFIPIIKKILKSEI